MRFVTTKYTHKKCNYERIWSRNFLITCINFIQEKVVFMKILSVHIENIDSAQSSIEFFCECNKRLIKSYSCIKFLPKVQ